MSDYHVDSEFKLFTADVTRRLQRAIDAGRDPEELWRNIGERLMESTSRNFEVQGRPDTWEALNLNYRLRYAARGRVKANLTKKGLMKQAMYRRFAGKKILTASGRLRRSLHYVYDLRRLLLGSNLVYAAIHQFGGETGSKAGRFVMKQRSYLVLQDEDRDGIVNHDVPAWLEAKLS